MLRTAWLTVLLLSVSMAGCLDNDDVGPADDLELTPVNPTLGSRNALSTISNPDGSLTVTFLMTTTGGANVLAGDDVEDMTEPFVVDSSVGMVQLRTSFVDAEDVGYLAGALIDGEGRPQCGVATYVEGASCSAPVTVNNTGVWTISFETVWGETRPDESFTAFVDLLPYPLPEKYDPLNGTDPTITFRTSVTGYDAGEDNVGLLADGSIFVQNGGRTLRSTDDGATWENVSPGGVSQPSFDPMLYVDPYRGRVYVDHLTIGCSNLYWSDDAGATWVANPTACGAPANDHQKISSGPNPVPENPAPATYYSYSSFGAGSWVSFSYDGGATWVSREVIPASDSGSAGFLVSNPNPEGQEYAYANTGPVHADELGNVYVPYYMCDRGGYMMAGISHDYGQTWKLVVTDNQTAPCYDVDPGLYTDTAGNVYMAYHRGDKGIFYVWSADHGETWSEPVHVSPPNLKSFVHVDMVAGDEGRIAIAYRATPDSDLGPNSVHGLSDWYMYTTFVTNANSADPVNQTAFTQDPVALDPVQRGPICTEGVACVAGRNLLDFIDIQVGPDGRTYVVYSDGCVEGCPTPGHSRADAGTVAILEDGPLLFENGAPWAP